MHTAATTTAKKRAVVFLSSLALLVIAGCASPPRSITTITPDRRPRPIAPTIGVASYYGRQYHGRKTASGEVYDMRKMTAAHRTLPFGVNVRVTDLASNRSVIVRINDRGPFTRGRIIDLSLAAAQKLGIVQTGSAT